MAQIIDPEERAANWWSGYNRPTAYLLHKALGHAFSALFWDVGLFLTFHSKNVFKTDYYNFMVNLFPCKYDVM